MREFPVLGNFLSSGLHANLDLTLCICWVQISYTRVRIHDRMCYYKIILLNKIMREIIVRILYFFLSVNIYVNMDIVESCLLRYDISILLSVL